MINEDIINHILNTVSTRRYVNLFSDGFKENEYAVKNEVIDEIKKMEEGGYCIDVNIGDLAKLPREEKVRKFLEIVNNNLSKAKFKYWLHEAGTIEHSMHRLNEYLEKPALLIFHLFENPGSEEEKDILRSIRIFIEMRESIFLGILVLSPKRIDQWDLFPYSDFDERHVEFLEYREKLSNEGKE